jgi:hypothetical protein
MKPYLVAFLVYGDRHSDRDALSEEKYKDLASAFFSSSFLVQSVLYNDDVKEDLYSTLLGFDAILVWVNPIEQGKDRKHLDALLERLSNQGCLVSAHPEVILKIGTKEVLFKTKDMDWGSSTRQYYSYEDFKEQFPKSLELSGIKIIKQYRGNGGNGVFKIEKGPSANEVIVLHAKRGEESKTLSWSDFFHEFRTYFIGGGTLIEQEWNFNHQNGMVRCYLCADKVVGFGYQEINALYELQTPERTVRLPPSTRYYFSENCGLFSDLKKMMETTWVPQLQQTQSISHDLLPVIWDADFFINKANSPTATGKYTLCEINVSSVSPFPPSAIPFIVKEVNERIQKIKNAKQ